jgi:hypothetical protein
VNFISTTAGQGRSKFPVIKHTRSHETNSSVPLSVASAKFSMLVVVSKASDSAQTNSNGSFNSICLRREDVALSSFWEGRRFDFVVVKSLPLPVCDADCATGYLDFYNPHAAVLHWQRTHLHTHMDHRRRNHPLVHGLQQPHLKRSVRGGTVQRQIKEVCWLGVLNSGFVCTVFLDSPKVSRNWLTSVA